MISIQTNVNSLVAQQNLSVNTAFQSKTIAQLTSGYRINQSGDDAAGLAVANKFRSAVAELTQGVANGNDAAAQLQIMDGGMSNISAILDRLKTLATQSASGTFTGDRTILNKEFQGDVGEIDRQAQSIGLDTGGIFAKSLNVYLGQGSGSQSLANAAVAVDLSKATVDSQSLGLKGMQAVVGTADLGSSSATSVANIVADTTNLAAVQANLGSTIFTFTGAGFSGVKVSVNPTGVSDLAGLVKNLNGAIQNEGNGSATGDSALKAAGIVASVHTDANGGQQLAFTSSTSAFQVAAGDRMANAMMGNFSSGATGASLTTSVIGRATTSGALNAGLNIEVKISGDDFAEQTIGLSTTTYTTTALAIADLKNEINTGLTTAGAASAAGAALKKAGISVALGGVNNDQLVFTNANNAKFTVQVSGDVGTVTAGGGNALGLGTSLSGAANAVTYSSITAGTAYDNLGTTDTAALGAKAQTTLEFSVAGSPAVSLGAIALDGGDATGGTNASDAIGTNGVVLANDTKFSFALDGKTITTGVLTASVNGGKASNAAADTVSIASFGPADYTAKFATTGIAGGIANAAALTTDFSAAVTNNTFLASYNGQVKKITLADSGAATSAGQLAINLQANLRAAFATTDITVTNNGGRMVVSTVATGANESLSFATDGTSTLRADLGLVATTYYGNDGNGGNNSFVVGVNGDTHSIKLTMSDADVNGLLTDVQAGLTAAGIRGVGAGKVDAAIVNGKLIFTTGDTGLNASVSFGAATKNDGSLDSTLGDLGLTTAATNGPYKGDAKTAANVADAINLAIQRAELATDPTTGVVGALFGSTWTSGVNDAAKAVADPTSGVVTITNNAEGADHSLGKVQQSTWNGAVWSGAANSALWSATAGGALSNASGNAAHGANRTLDSLVSAINSGIQGNSALNAAGLQASKDVSGHLVISSTSGTQFQVNVGAAEAKGTAVGAVDVSSGLDFSTAPVSLKLSTDGGVTTRTVNLTQKDSTASQVLAEITGQLAGSGATASLLSVNGKNYIQIAANGAGATNDLVVEAASGNAALGLTSGTYAAANEANLGFAGVSNKTFAGIEGVNGGVSTLTGVSASGSAQTGGLTFKAIASGDGTQALTIAANDSAGVMQATTITLAATNSGSAALSNDGTASSIDKAVAYINSQLQKTNNPTLMGVVAVEQNVNGSPEINFISALSNFQVSVGSNATAGVNGGAAETASGKITGTGSTIAVDTQSGALAAVSALASAIGKLGTAQAAVGKGQNQLTYAISLAQSQITNFSAAESQIRDANVAQQAANLSKAQVLSQASIAAMAQANSAPQAVLSLLRG